MKARLQGAHLRWALALAIALGSPGHAIEILTPGQVLVVNMISPDQGDETRRDSEPNLAVNPANPLHMAASAFTPSPWPDAPCNPPAIPGPCAPIYISTDGGRNWALNTIIPFNHPVTGTGDITLRFSPTSGVLYVSALQKTDTGNPTNPSEYKLRILRTSDFTSAAPMENLSTYALRVDQPYVQVMSALTSDGLSNDRVYVGYSDLEGAGTRTATIQMSLNAAASPAVWQWRRIEKRDTCGWDGPTRAAVHGDGTVYAAFFRYTAGCPTPAIWNSATIVVISADIVVVRDDNWASGSDAFANLTDPSDTLAGKKVVETGVSIPFTTGHPDALRLGKQRIGGQISIAVDPSSSDRVYVAWADGDSPDNYTIRVRRSTDRGATWEDLTTVTKATNPSLAVNSHGKIGFLYQKFVACSAPEGCWETHMERSSGDFSSPTSDLVLHVAADNIDGPDGAGPLGDYNHLMAIGTDFFGVFSGNNTPDMANFPQGVIYRRNAIFSSVSTVRKLLANDGTSVAASVDPFFFVVSEGIGLDRCNRYPWLCDFGPKLERRLIKLKCLMHGCTVIDLLPRNCPVKFKCPGCAPGGMCPPFYHLHLDGLKAAWRVGLLDSRGKPVAHRQFKTPSGLVVSFRPSKEKFIAEQIGSYLLAFEMGSSGKVGAEYRVRTRLTRSERHYEP